MTTLSQLKREIEIVKRAIIPQEKVRMGLDEKRVPPELLEIVMEAGKLGLELKRKLGRWPNFNDLTPEQKKLALRSEEIWNEYAEPESEIRRRRPPLH